MNILILSAGTRNKVVQYFKHAFAGSGKVIATDMSKLAPAVYEADKFYQVPRTTDAGYIDVIFDICRKESINGVLSLIDPELSLLAKHKEEFADLGVTVIGSSYGEGLNVRDWLYVEDHCKAIDLIIHKGRVGEVYNIGGHNEMKNIDIVKIICKALDKPESLITYVTDRKGHDMRYAIDPTKIHNELGWLPETMFAEGIQKTIQWYLDNKEWWQTIISGEYQNYYEKMYSNR